jgi:type I restriction enzyme S subunit
MTSLWPEVELGTIAEKLQDGPFGSNLKSSHYVEDGVRVVRLQNIGVGYFDDTNQAFVDRDHFRRLNKHECVAGDVLIATLGDPIVRAAVLPPTIALALNKADCVQLRCHQDRAVPEYVSHYLNSPRAQSHAAERSHGQTRPRVNLSQLRTMPIPLPPIEEQRRIAAVLDAADTLRTKRRQALAKLDALTHAIFNDMFGDPLSPAPGLKVVELGAVARFVRGVTFKPADVLNSPADGAVAVLRTTNVQSELDLSDVWYVSEAFVKRADQYLQPCDTLISSANSWNLVGRCCLIPASVGRATFGGFVTVLRPSCPDLLPRFLHSWFSSSKLQQTVRTFGRKTTNISNLDLKQCARLPIAVPPAGLQREFEERLKQIAVAKVRNDHSLARLDTLFSSLQQQAFRGD